MAVNGIEIKVGQKWRTRDGDSVSITQVDGDEMFGGVNYPVVGYEVFENSRHTWLLDGRNHAGREVGKDLVELIEDAPSAEPAAIEAPTTASAPDLLDAAAGHMRDRAATYDKPEGERSMAQTVAVFNQFHGTALTEAQGWHFMQILKDVRLFANPANPHRDSVEDGVAYSALKGEAILKGGV